MAVPTTSAPQPTVPADQSEYSVIGPGYTYETVEKQIGDIVLTRPLTLGWIVGFLGAATLLLLLHFAIVYLFQPSLRPGSSTSFDLASSR